MYLCRPEVRWMRVIAGACLVAAPAALASVGRARPAGLAELMTAFLSLDQIKSSAAGAHQYHLLVVPRMTTVCTTLLSDLGVLGSIDVQELQLGLIPLEKDLLSLESEDVWRKLALVSFRLVATFTPANPLARSPGWRLLPRLRHGESDHDNSARVWTDPAHHRKGRFGQSAFSQLRGWTSRH